MELIGMLPLKQDDERIWMKSSYGQDLDPHQTNSARKNFLVLREKAVGFMESMMDERIYDFQQFLHSVPFI
jgi:hypothetical protein